MTRTLVSSADGAVSGWLSVAEAGPGRPLLVCIHGGGCNGNYFDLKGCSTLAAAHERGLAVLLVNRPGYAGNPLPASDRPIADAVLPIRRFVDEVRALPAVNADAIAVIGHSIGGAVAFRLASQARDWPLRAVAVSAIADTVGSGLAGIAADRTALRIDAPAGLDALLFENGGEALSWKPLASLRRATEPWLVPEMVEVVERWPHEWPDVAAEITVPVHYRLAEHERLWKTGPDVVERIAARLGAAASVDAALLRGGGHLYETSKRGPELVAAQLDFIAAHTG